MKKGFDLDRNSAFMKVIQKSKGKSISSEQQSIALQNEPARKVQKNDNNGMSLTRTSPIDLCGGGRFSIRPATKISKEELVKKKKCSANVQNRYRRALMGMTKNNKGQNITDRYMNKEDQVHTELHDHKDKDDKFNYIGNSFAKNKMKKVPREFKRKPTKRQIGL
jgi:hypothetical protein